ncbi:hypothetical protein PACID_03150 [Acidipropionibacterium acidipropionici ATCC 4875]|uniref:DUF3052 domain-containing protein n=1 Tax=Acidipropionibacterium acidipropionici (strain ATCC 4875 / DSM 20272 / JCM 6432 / NBRC 12425 / NCIMB 8070 / 4) TaxID=1171373 RepID=K7RJT6_ACIA4|nr:hypothetical protein [Acidipropionibacterium acidipropionici]AFV88164.1 hypothetical protein PACID_03150 [Acidipropionibacterium acidipropionici ATCC 4875]
MPDLSALARKLQLKPGNTVWVWPPNSPAAEALLEDQQIPLADPNAADVALLFTADRTAAQNALTQFADALAATRAVWFIYVKGNRTDINRDTLHALLLEHGWRAISQVSYDGELSALRSRPLKPGESTPT